MTTWIEKQVNVARRERTTMIDGVELRLAEGESGWHWRVDARGLGLPVRNATIGGLVATEAEAERMALGCVAIVGSALVETEVVRLSAESLAVCESRSVASCPGSRPTRGWPWCWLRS
jgi:hypothetical protein